MTKNKAMRHIALMKDAYVFFVLHRVECYFYSLRIRVIGTIIGPISLRGSIGKLPEGTGVFSTQDLRRDNTLTATKTP